MDCFESSMMPVTPGRKSSEDNFEIFDYYSEFEEADLEDFCLVR
jgi:hypothetical protein